MPRSNSSTYPIDEDRLIDLVRLNPELYDETEEASNNTILKKNIWKKIAKELDAPVDMCKKVWTKIKENHVRDGKSRDTKTDRRKSLRSGSAEKSLGFLDLFSAVNSNENSRASSNCNSPKNEEKRRLRSSSRSLSHLGAISETDLASLASSSDATIAQNEKPGTKSVAQSAGRTPRKIQNLDKGMQAEDTNERYQKIPQPAERNLRSRFSEPSHLASKEVLQAAVNSTPRRQPGSGPNGRNGRMKRSPNPSDSTRAFFESMALTVSTFPQHLQAAMKVQICTMVAETEYDLSSPKVR